MDAFDSYQLLHFLAFVLVAWVLWHRIERLDGDLKGVTKYVAHLDEADRLRAADEPTQPHQVASFPERRSRRCRVSCRARWIAAGVRRGLRDHPEIAWTVAGAAVVSLVVAAAVWAVPLRPGGGRPEAFPTTSPEPSAPEPRGRHPAPSSAPKRFPTATKLLADDDAEPRERRRQAKAPVRDRQQAPARTSRGEVVQDQAQVPQAPDDVPTPRAPPNDCLVGLACGLARVEVHL